MHFSQSKQTQETIKLLQDMQQQLITLAVSLKGRLSPTEKETLARLFQTQVDLQALIKGGATNGNHLPIPNVMAEDDSQSDDLKAQEAEQDMSEIFTQLMLYATLIYNETAGNKNSEAAKYATEISRIVKDVQKVTNRPIELPHLDPTLVPLTANAEIDPHTAWILDSTEDD